MKNKLYIIICLVVVLSSCNRKKEEIKNIFPIDINETSQDQIHKILGEPSEKLIDMQGEVYLFENKTKFTIFYDDNKIVKSIITIDDTITIDEMDINGVLTNIRESSQEQIHKILGKPSGELFGMYGEVYLFENKTKLTIYYDNAAIVKHIVIIDKEDIKTFTTEE